MFEIRGFENKILTSTQWITGVFEKQGILSCFLEKQNTFDSAICLFLQVELLLFDNGRQPVNSMSCLSQVFFLKWSRILSHHLWDQIFHSSSNLSVESMNV